jgi:2-desacetyl-2-hydroxyethyl bacteriochlorophyllide A dehydrogenase
MAHPLVPGYQKVGTVMAVGSDVKDLSIGQWVFATSSMMDDPNASRGWGGHIEHSVQHQNEVIPLPADIDPMAAAGLVLTQVGFNGGSRPPVNDGDRAIVVGDGLVGQWLAQTLRHRGAHVVLVGRRPDRLALAEKYSADVVANSHDTSLEEVAAEHGPDGFAIIGDTVGTAESVESLLRLVGHNGNLILNGYYREGQHLLSINQLHGREVTVHSPSGWSRDRLTATLELVAAGALKTSELTTHIFDAEAASDAYDLVLNKPEPFLGIVIKWREPPGV